MTAVVAVPRLELAVAGSAATPLAQALTAVRVSQRVDAPAQCELTFADPPGPLDDAVGLALGAQLRLAVAGEGVPVFEGEVTAVEAAYGPDGSREVRVRGYDRLHRLRGRQEAKAYERVTPADVAGELAAAAGLSVQADEPGPTLPLVLQHRQTDLELLAEVAGRAGLWFALRGEVVHLFPPTGIGSPVQLTLGHDLFEAAVERNAVGAIHRVETEAWDPLRAEAHRGAAADARRGTRVPAPGGEGAARRLPGVTAEDDVEAASLAQGELDRRAAGEVVLRGVCDGDPRLRPGTPVDVAGLHQPLCGRYVVTAAEHLVGDRSGYVTRVSTAPPEPGPPPGRAATMALGLVESVEDPDGLGRVQVRLPAHGDLASAWMQVAAAGAGAAKGLVALPGRGDRVLVLLAGDDPARGVVVGSLFGADGPPDAGVDGGAVVRWTLTTAAGHAVTLDEAERRLRIEDATGSSLELAPDLVRLHAVTDLVVEAPGRRVAIRASAVDFEKA